MGVPLTVFSSRVLDTRPTESGTFAVVDELGEEQPHGMLIDLNMPDLDGLEVVRRVRARKQLEGVQLVTMTARHSPGVVQQSLKAGAMACLAKPVDVQEVLKLFKVPVALAAKR